MDDLGALRLNQPAHDVYGGVVAVEQGRGGNKAQWRLLGVDQSGRR
jgi:hypothetical protein